MDWKEKEQIYLDKLNEQMREIERLRVLIRAHVTASNNDDTAGDTFGALMAEVSNAAMRGSPASSATPLDGRVMQKEE